MQLLAVERLCLGYTRIRLEGGLLIRVCIFWLPNKHVVSWLTHCKYSTNVYWMYWSPYPSKLSRIHLLKETIFPLFSLFFFSFSCSIFSLKKKFIFGCAGSSLLQAFSICGERGLLFLVPYGLTILEALTGRWA